MKYLFIFEDGALATAHDLTSEVIQAMKDGYLQVIAHQGESYYEYNPKTDL